MYNDLVVIEYEICLFERKPVNNINTIESILETSLINYKLYCYTSK